jgi:hypothetical protein
MRKPKSPISTLAYWLGEVNIFIALAAGSSALATFAFYDKVYNWHIIAFVAFAALFTYNLQRKIGDLEMPGEFSHAKSTLTILGGLGMLAFIYYLSWFQIISLALAGIISLAYAYPCIPWKGQWYSLRKIPYLKLWVIVLTWVLSTSIIPLEGLLNLALADDRMSMALFALQQGAFITALTIPFDVRDLQADEPYHKTLPMIFGIEKALKIARYCLWLSTAAALFNYLYGYFEIGTFIIHLALCLPAMWIISKTHQNRPQLFYTLLLDGFIVLQGAILGVLS